MSKSIVPSPTGCVHVGLRMAAFLLVILSGALVVWYVKLMGSSAAFARHHPPRLAPTRPQHDSLALWPDERPTFPLDLDAFRTCLAFALSVGWLEEANLGMSRTWEDITFLCKNWDSPLVHAVATAKFQFASGVEGPN